MQYPVLPLTKGCIFLYILAQLFSGNARNAHSFEGDGLLKVKSINMTTNPLHSSWPSESFTSMQVSSSISSMSQHTESGESTADNKHVYEVMGKRNPYYSVHCLVQEAEEDVSADAS